MVADTVAIVSEATALRGVQDMRTLETDTVITESVTIVLMSEKCLAKQ